MVHLVEDLLEDVFHGGGGWWMGEGEGKKFEFFLPIGMNEKDGLRGVGEGEYGYGGCL